MQLIAEITKYMMLILLGNYTYFSFRILRYRNKQKQERTYSLLTVIIFSLHFIGYMTLLLQTGNLKLLLLYGGEVIVFILILSLYHRLYPKLSRLLLRNMLMLLSIGFIILARLSFDKAIKQVLIVALSFMVCLIVPYIIKRYSWLKRFGLVYGAFGIALLAVVLVAGSTYYGATNWLNIGGIIIQPSEFVKLLYVFGIAAMFHKAADFKRICAVTVMAGANVLILVLQKDLGGALIFFVTYVFMLYAATAKPIYFFAGLAGGSAAAYIAYQLFGHVRVRVMAWQNPFGYIDDEGYQISQSLFAIGTGGWFGMGLNRGLPTSIPVVDSDFIFSAISEELGGFFAICIILLYINCFILFINIALEQESAFSRYVSLGFSVMFGFQIVLSIGGVIKFIPSTGVTLPLISYGGSSALSTILMFMVLQGIYMKGKHEKKNLQTEINAEEKEVM
jgi:peptidoglycan glycosyltransferase